MIAWLGNPVQDHRSTTPGNSGILITICEGKRWKNKGKQCLKAQRSLWGCEKVRQFNRAETGGAKLQYSWDKANTNKLFDQSRCSEIEAILHPRTGYGLRVSPRKHHTKHNKHSNSFWYSTLKRCGCRRSIKKEQHVSITAHFLTVRILPIFPLGYTQTTQILWQ